MSDFLTRMAVESRRRVDLAVREVSAEALRARIATLPPPAPLPPSQEFDIIAEVKKRSPAAGKLRTARGFAVTAQAATYANTGAAVISVLTEPSAFDGQLRDLADVAGQVDTPTMRKDFLVDPYQLLEARVSGASGALLIARLLDDEMMTSMLDTARECELFVLIEAFDREDVRRATRAGSRALAAGLPVLVGVNCRDLRSLEVDPLRFAELADALPQDIPGVAESGMHSELDVARVAGLGYRYALIGTALMESADPGHALKSMLRSGREEARRRCA